MTSIIRLFAITNHFSNDSFRLRKGEDALLSGHVMSCQVDREMGFMSGKVQASQKKEVREVQVFFNSEEVKDDSCSCPIGKFGKCHHIAALLLYANRNISSTDVACSWTHKTKAGHDNEGLPIDHYYPLEDGDYRAVSTPLSSDEIHKARARLHECSGAALSMKWLSDPEPLSDFLTNLSQPQPLHVQGVIKIPPIEEAISSPAFKSCVTLQDKIDHVTRFCNFTGEDIVKNAASTAGQSDNLLWGSLHTHVMTASNFGFGIRASTNERSCSSLLQSIAGKKWCDEGDKKIRKSESERATDWGKNNESTALKCFGGANPQYTISTTGLWFHPSGILGASPDALVDNDAVAEVKCPFSMRAVGDIVSHLKEKSHKSKKNVICIGFDDEGGFIVDKNHDHYHQMQGQMLCTHRQACHYIIWTAEDCISATITRDEDWMRNKVPLLFKTYFDRYVPYAFPDLCKNV